MGLYDAGQSADVFGVLLQGGGHCGPALSPFEMRKLDGLCQSFLAFSQALEPLVEAIVAFSLAPLALGQQLAKTLLAFLAFGQ